MCRRFPAAGVSITPTLVTVQQILVPLDHLRALVTDDAGKVDLRGRYLAKVSEPSGRRAPRGGATAAHALYQEPARDYVAEGAATLNAGMAVDGGGVRGDDSESAKRMDLEAPCQSP